MELKIVWTDTAKFQLEDIFNYHKDKTSLNSAKKIISKIISKSILLENNPNIGRKEPLLENRKFEYRFIIESNYKIIYWNEKKYIKIATVFDCRQNPVKINTEL